MIQSVDLNRLPLFLSIVEAGNISRAARSLGLRKAKLSRDLALLEEELGAQLVYRTTRQFRLTEAGRSLYEEAKGPLLGLHSVLERTAEHSERIAGEIRLTCPEDIGQMLIVPLIETFHEAHPEVTFSIEFSSEVVDLVAKRVDLAVRIGKLVDSSMRVRKVGQVRFGLVCAPEVFDRLPRRLDIDGLTKLPTIGFATSTTPEQHWELRAGRRCRKIRIAPSITANSFAALLHFVLDGHGIALLPHFLYEPQVGNGRLVRILREWSGIPAPVQLVTPGQREVPARIRSAREALARGLQAHL